jgi:hypothetical protein
MRFDIRITNGKTDRANIAGTLRTIADLFLDERLDPSQSSTDWCGWVCDDEANCHFEWDFFSDDDAPYVHPDCQGLDNGCTCPGCTRLIADTIGVDCDCGDGDCETCFPR